MPFEYIPTELPGVIELRTKQFFDDRGYFAEIVKISEFVKNGVLPAIAQVNSSYSKANVLRGLHYQLAPYAQGKLISVAVGEVFDVAVDIRVGSPTYGKWAGVTLSAKEQNMLYVPEGFAHGFLVTSPEARVVYYCTSEYSPEYERGIAWNDIEIGVDWPFSDVVVNEKDASFGSLSGAENNFVYPL